MHGLNSQGMQNHWSKFALNIENHMSAYGLRCQLVLAHWFEITLGPIAPHDKLIIHLDTHIQTGEVTIQNKRGDLMSVEQIYCGSEDNSRNHWHKISLQPIRRAITAQTLWCDTEVCRYEE